MVLSGFNESLCIIILLNQPSYYIPVTSIQSHISYMISYIIILIDVLMDRFLCTILIQIWKVLLWWLFFIVVISVGLVYAYMLLWMCGRLSILYWMCWDEQLMLVLGVRAYCLLSDLTWHRNLYYGSDMIMDSTIFS